MAQQSSFYNTDGTTRTYPSSKHIASKQHVAVYFKSATTSTWSIIEDGLYDLVNNSIVFSDAPDSVLYSQIEIRVADTAAELTDSPSDIALVAGAIGDISAIVPSLSDIATLTDNLAALSEISGSIVPNLAEILLADTNATTATTQASIATTKASELTASALEAEHWASYTVDVPVPEGTGEFSAKHYSVKASEYAASVNPSNIMHLTGNESASGVKTFTSGINAPQLVGFKNHIINGNFDIWQRGTSQTTAGYGSDDRWNNANAGSTKTHSRVACTDTERALFNANYFSRTVVNSVAGGLASKLQRIEDVTRLQGKTVTLSFWAKADSNKNIAIEFVQNFGTGGSPSSQVDTIGSQLVALTTTWQKKTITVAIPSIIGKTLGTDGVSTSNIQLAFYYDDGITPSRSANLGQQSGTFDIAQVQLEEGSVATPFEQRPIGLELSLCQRYYWKSSVSGIVVYNSYIGTNEGFIKNPVPMRAVPTVVSYAAAFEHHHDNNFDYIASRNTTGEIAVAWVNSSLVRQYSGRFDAVVSASAEL